LHLRKCIRSPIVASLVMVGKILCRSAEFANLSLSQWRLSRHYENGHVRKTMHQSYSSKSCDVTRVISLATTTHNSRAEISSELRKQQISTRLAGMPRNRCALGKNGRVAALGRKPLVCGVLLSDPRNATPIRLRLSNYQILRCPRPRGRLFSQDRAVYARHSPLVYAFWNGSPLVQLVQVTEKKIVRKREIR